MVFLDIDGTLLPRSLEQWFVPYLIQEGLMRPAKAVVLYCRSLLSASTRSWFDLKLRYLAGIHLATVEQWAKECWEKVVKGRLFPGIAPLVQELQHRGVRIVILSGAPTFLAAPLARHLGIAELVCAEPALVDGVLTGSLARPHPRGVRKVTAARQWLQEQKLLPAQAGAIADHWDDRFLLSFVGWPVVVRPGLRLALLAHRRSWIVIKNPYSDQETEKILRQAFSRGKSNYGEG
ncbi:MAG: HAD-IB family phosphatase [bacterium]|nr:HAD-IB family phosphatase [candidate division KSB1 bacterium]MDH7558811.1 HAD-IB family phosphatase [bacterium]